MSWPGEEWKTGLSPQALRAVAELEQRLGRAQKERQQKQLQLDTLEGLMDKQRQKHEEEKASWALLSQENRTLEEARDHGERARQRLAQDLQAKEAQVSCLEAQLAQATRRQAELEEELHCCQAQLEKLQTESRLPRLPPRRSSPTPTPPTPWAEGGAEAKPDNNKNPAAATAAERSSPSLGEPCKTDMPPRDAPFPSGDGAWSTASELASEGETLRTENQELRLALAQADRRIHEKDQELRSLQGQVERVQLELAEWKKEPAGAQDFRGRRLSGEATRSRRSREQEKGTVGTERPSYGGSRRSASSSRLEQLAEKRGSATRPKGSAIRSPKALSTERNQEELRAEVSSLRRRLEASENQRKNLLETCWQQQRTRAWVQERQMPLLGLRAASWQRKKEGRHHQSGSKAQHSKGKEAFVADETNGKSGALEAGGQKVPEAWTAVLPCPEASEPETGTPDPLVEPDKEGVPPIAKAEETETLTQEDGPVEGTCEPKENPAALSETIRALAAGKAEAEARAGRLEQKLQTLQATLGGQTERLAEALEAQRRHVEELVADAEEKERLASRLRRELEEATKEREEASAEKRRLQGLLEQQEEERSSSGARKATEWHGDRQATERTKSLLAWGPRGKAPPNGRSSLAAPRQKEKQAELETFLAQLLRENQALRHELIHWEAMVVENGELDSSSISSALHGEATAVSGQRKQVKTPAWESPEANVLQASRKVALLIQESQRDEQTQTDGGHEVGAQPRRRERVSVAFDDTQYEPYGLPEVVMKGFADIPEGPSCPYVLRRGILGSAPVAQLAPKAEPEEDGLEPEEEETSGI